VVVRRVGVGLVSLDVVDAGVLVVRVRVLGAVAFAGRGRLATWVELASQVVLVPRVVVFVPLCLGNVLFVLGKLGVA